MEKNMILQLYDRKPEKRVILNCISCIHWKYYELHFY